MPCTLHPWVQTARPITPAAAWLACTRSLPAEAGCPGPTLPRRCAIDLSNATCADGLHSWLARPIPRHPYLVMQLRTAAYISVMEIGQSLPMRMALRVGVSLANAH